MGILIVPSSYLMLSAGCVSGRGKIQHSFINKTEADVSKQMFVVFVLKMGSGCQNIFPKNTGVVGKVSV
jgi:hypothetical protein